MKPVEWQELQEAAADMAKTLGGFKKDLLDSGFSRGEAFNMTKEFLLAMISKERG